MPKISALSMITNRELDVLEILWAAEKPLVASEIAKRGNKLTINTVQAVLRKLQEKQYAEIDGIVYSGNVLSRSYRACITSQDLAVSNLVGSFKKLSNVSTTGLITSLLEKEEISDKEIEELEQLLKVQKEKLTHNKQKEEPE